ncbi:MAG TPA: hypothetical protein VMV44_10280 [Rectinemataceae bacterium]|nr:hypothetical protein [Rectinemataceae bacterium]
MPFTIGDLITLGIVVATLAAWRFLDRDNRSLEKVKKLGDRLQGELGAYVDRRVEDLKQYAIDLDVRNKSAKEVLKRLQSVEEGLVARAEDMATIGKRIAEYDESLARLMDMTARVDENLARIQNESEFTDGVARKIEAAAKSLASVESGVALLRDDFARDNLAALETARDGLFADTETRIADIRELLVKAEADAELTVSNAAAAKREAEREFAKAFEKARGEAEKLEDAAFEKLRQASEAKAAKLKDAVEDKFAQIAQLAKDRLAETQALAKAFKTEWKAEAEDFMGGFKTAIAAETEAATQKTRTAVAALETRIVDAGTGLVALSSSLEAEKTRLETLAAEAGAASETRLEAIAKKTEAAATSMEQRVGAVEELVEQRLGILAKKADEVALGLGEKLKSLLSSQKDDFAQRAVDAKAAQAAAIAELKTGVEAAKETRASAIAELRAAFETAKTEKEGLQSELAAALGAAKAEAAEFAARLAGNGEARSLEVLAAVERRLDDYGAEVEAKFRRLEAVNVDIGVLEGALRSAMSEVGNRVEAEFTAWGHAVTERRNEFESGFTKESERLAVSMRSLEEELDSLKSRAYDNVSQKLKVFEDEFFADLRERRESADAALAAWKLERDSTIADLDSTIAEKQETLRRKAEAGIAAFAERVGKDLESARKTADERIVADIGTWKAGLENLVSRTKAEYEQQHEAWLGKAREERDGIRKDIEQLLARSTELGGSLEKRVAEAIRHLDEESGRLSKTVSDIDREQKAFVAQTKIFERSDELVAKLSKAIETMKTELGGIEAKRQELVELEDRLGKVRRLEEDLNQRIAKFLAEKKRVDTLEEGFARLATVSEGVDRKLADITGQGDALTEAQARIRRLLELSSEAEAKYDRLEKKGEVIDATVEMVDKNFRTASEIERSVVSIGAELKRLPDRIAEVERNVSVLAAGKERADEAARKLGELDSIMVEAERRIGEAQKVREWLARSETRLEEINRQVEEQLKLLSTLLKDEGGDKKGRGAPPGGVQDTVRKLARQGWSADEIARAVKISRGEVELILELGAKG